MRELFKLFKNICLCMIVITIVIFYSFDLTFMTTHNFDMITLNTILVGFLFTIYTLLVSLINEEAVKTYSETNELPKIFKNIVVGIVLGILTCLLSMVILCIYGEPKSLTMLNKLLYAIDISMFIIVLSSMIMAILNMASIVNAVRAHKFNEIKKQKANKEMEYLFNEKDSNN